MAKVTVNELTSLTSETSAIQLINANFSAIVEAIENTFSRDGTTPNSLSASLDLNSNRILNLPEPSTATEPLRLGDIGGVLPDDIADAGVYAAQAIEAAEEAAASAEEAAGYVGSALQAPKWTTARSITFSGSDISGTSPTWDGSANLTWTGVSIVNGSVTALKLGTGSVVTHLGYTPASLAGATFTGDCRLNFTATSLSTDSVGFRGIPVNSQNGAYAFLIPDSGRMVRHNHGSAHAWTISPNSTTAFPIGTAIVVRNIGAGVVTLTRGSGVALRKSGSATDANVALAQWGLATLVQEDTDVWVVTGTGLT